jgi:hypothetical protein
VNLEAEQAYDRGYVDGYYDAHMDLAGALEAEAFKANAELVPGLQLARAIVQELGAKWHQTAVAS